MMYKILYQELQDYVFDTDCSGIMTRARFSGKKGSFEPSCEEIENRGEQDMEKLITIYNTEYAIPAVFSYSQKHEKMPAVILCHGTGSQKNEVGNLFAEMSKRLLNIGIASIRLDYAGCGDSKACQTKLSFCGEVNDTKKVYQYLYTQDFIDCNNIGILGFSQGARVMAELLKEVHSLKFAISWSGACHDGIGVFKGWFDEYYQEALENGYAKIPMFWRENLLLSKKMV